MVAGTCVRGVREDTRRLAVRQAVGLPWAGGCLSVGCLAYGEGATEGNMVATVVAWDHQDEKWSGKEVVGISSPQ